MRPNAPIVYVPHLPLLQLTGRKGGDSPHFDLWTCPVGGIVLHKRNLHVVWSPCFVCANRTAMVQMGDNRRVVLFLMPSSGCDAEALEEAIRASLKDVLQPSQNLLLQLKSEE